jgi:hypothetical protein
MKNLVRFVLVLVLAVSFLEASYEKFKKAESIYVVPANELLKIVNSEIDLQKSLLRLMAIKKDDSGEFIFNTLKDMKFENSVVDWVYIHGLDKIAYNRSGSIVVTGSMSTRVGLVFYFSKKYEVQKVVIIKNPKDDGKMFYNWRQFLSNDGKYLYIHELLKLVDLDTFESIKIGEKDTIQKSSSSNYRSILYDAKFSPNNKYLIFKTHTKGILLGDTVDFKSEQITNIETKKGLNGARFESFFSLDDKYRVEFDTYKHRDLTTKISLHVGTKFESKYVFEKNYKKLFTYDASWRKNRLFLDYSYKDISDKNHWDRGGIFDVETSQIMCKDSFKVGGNLIDIGWIDDKTLYVLDDKALNYFVIEDEECLRVKSKNHYIKKLKKANKTYLEDGVLTVYPNRKSGKEEIKKIKLEQITEDIVEIHKSFIKINKLLNADFEKRALKTIDNLIDSKYKVIQKYQYNSINAKKNNAAYISYFLAKHLRKKLESGSELDGNVYEFYRVYMIYALWNGYYSQANELISYMKTRLKNHNNIDAKIEEKLKNLINLHEALFLICIGKDEDGYDKLFDMQPISKEIKTQIKILTIYQTPFSKNRDKLVAALDIKKSDLGENKELKNRATIFFDINENKITDGKKEKKKVFSKVSKKSEAIKLLE